jgi:hypothetical protein
LIAGKVGSWLLAVVIVARLAGDERRSKKSKLPRGMVSMITSSVLSRRIQATPPVLGNVMLCADRMQRMV